MNPSMDKLAWWVIWYLDYYKFQITNIKQITMTKIQNFKHLVIEHWNLRFICNLVLGIWDFISECFKHQMFSSNFFCEYATTRPRMLHTHHRTPRR